MRSRREWWKASNGLIAVGIVLAISGARGVMASAARLQGDPAALGYELLAGGGSVPEDGPLFLPPTLRPSPTATPFDDIRPLPGSDPLEAPPTTRTPFPTLDPSGYPPDRIIIPSIQLDAPVLVSKASLITLQGEPLLEWMPPNKFAAGWQETSAPLGVVGNTVLNGHNSIYGDVFEKLEKVQEGDTIQMYSGDAAFLYQVTNRLILAEKYQALTVRLGNAQWISPSQDERLTLVTCWPRNGNSHRLILVARPLGNSIQGTDNSLR